MNIRGEFHLPAHWPEKAQNDLIAFGDGKIPSWAEGVVAVNLYGAKIGVAYDRDSRVFVNGKSEGQFDLDGLCVAIEAVMRHYELPGSVTIVTAGERESPNEEIGDALVTRVAASGRWDLNSADISLQASDADVAKRLMMSILELPSFRNDKNAIWRLLSQSSIKEDGRRPYAVTLSEAGELYLYVYQGRHLGEGAVCLKVPRNSEATEILSEALQTARKEFGFGNKSAGIRIFSSGMPQYADTQGILKELAERLGYETVVDTSVFVGASDKIEVDGCQGTTLKNIFLSVATGQLPDISEILKLSDDSGWTLAHEAAA
ncbi:MAG: hypothetical protein LBC94_00235, partial [Desulfovibrio sp.]|nr:hypothetical protein [Desulfovibrio sp.]